MVGRKSKKPPEFYGVWGRMRAEFLKREKPAIYHHLYNFGNTSIFMVMGKFEKQYTATKNGPSVKTVIPLGLTLDERICGGASFGQGIAYFKKCLADPTILETRPEKVNLETKMK